MQSFIAAHKSRLGLVSLEAPLIANLAVWSNIALIRQYHENMPWHEARAFTEALLHRLGMASIMDKRNPALTSEEAAFILDAVRGQDPALIRGLIQGNMDILTNLRDGCFIMENLRKLDDLIAETHIFDYNWEKERYGGWDGTES